MKRLIKALLATMIITMLSVTSVMAGNVTSGFTFKKNGQKMQSTKSEIKAKDNDTYAYITTLAGGGGERSTLFLTSGRLYAKLRLETNPEVVTSPLFTFYSNTAQKKGYGPGAAQFGKKYILRTETEAANYGGKNLVQWVKWCP